MGGSLWFVAWPTVTAEGAQLTVSLLVFQEVLRGTRHGQGDSGHGTNQLVHQPSGSKPSCAAEW